MAPLDTGLQATWQARPRDVGGHPIRRVLPTAARRTVGPYIFLDHIGPLSLPAGEGIDVPPHPHIGLATVTYLFEGELFHRDSVGSAQRIVPGDINWMVAGRGITHSERSPAEARAAGASIHGVQIWVALPKEHEETDPTFQHYPAASLPRLERDGVHLGVLAGEAYGVRSPVRLVSPLIYVDAALDDGANLALPEGPSERAAYVVDGEVLCGSTLATAGTIVTFAEGSAPALVARGPARLVVIGGAPLPEPRHIAWNFVSTSKERIERAKTDWRGGAFPRVVGDEAAPVPLPE